MTDQWKFIDGTDHRYVVFSDGDVLTSYYRFVHGPHIMRSFRTEKGYRRITLFVRGKHRKYAVHRLVASAFLSCPDPTYEVNHKNGIKFDNRLENLEWVSKSENALHSIRTGLQIVKRGDQRISNKLSEKQVLAVYEARKGGEKNISISRRTGIKPKTVSEIWTGKRWGWLTRKAAA